MLGPPEIAREEIELGSVLGEGTFGTVYRGTCRAKAVAVKVLHHQEMDEESLDAFRREVEMVSKIFHPNVVLFMGACVEPGSLMIVTELMEKGNLESLLRDTKTPLSLFKRMSMMRDVALAVNWLHKSKPQIIHRDLKPGNLLLGRNGEIKVGDFGLSETFREGSQVAQETKGSPLWMAPEALSGGAYDEKVDTYAFGIILWEAVTREEPFMEYSSYEEFMNAVVRERCRPRIPRGTPQLIRRLMEQCWQQNSKSRPTFDAIIRQLDVILVHVAIRDRVGLRFWLEHFQGQESVNWEAFLHAFLCLLDQHGDSQAFRALPAAPSSSDLHTASRYQLSEFGARGPRQAQYVQVEETRRESTPHASSSGPVDYDSDLQLRCLRLALFESSEGDEISLEQFGSYLNWFGPMARQGQVVLHHNVTSILTEHWFHGDIDAKMAGERLTSGPPGGFLVRFSSITGCFTVSCMDSSRAIKHYRVVYDEERGFYWNSIEAPTLPEFVHVASTSLGLQVACPGSRYLAELEKDSLSNGYLTQLG